MRNKDTSIGGKQRGFPSTTWHTIARLSEGDDSNAREAFERLCRLYWKPVYRYLRIARVRRNEDAKDLTQTFFLWLMEGEVLKKYAREQGSFRTFLKVLLNRFVWHQDQSRDRLKRGGGSRIASLEEMASLDSKLPEDPDSEDPARAFDRAWLAELIQQAMARVRARFHKDGKGLAIDLYDAYEEAAQAEGATYAGLAARFGVTPSDVGRLLFAVREAIRFEIRLELADQLLEGTDLDQEWNELLQL